MPSTRQRSPKPPTTPAPPSTTTATARSMPRDHRNGGDTDPDHDAHHGRHHDLESDIGPARRYAGPASGDEKVIGMSAVAGQKRALAR